MESIRQVKSLTHTPTISADADVEKRQDWSDPNLYKGVDFAAAYKKGQEGGSTGGSTGGSSSGGSAPAYSSSAAAPAPSASGYTPSSSASAPSSTPSGSTGASGGSFNGCTATPPSGSGDTYKGNVGSPYGCNIQECTSTSGYDYTTTFKSTASSPRNIEIWNVAGSDGQPLSGKSLPPAVSFTLGPNESKVVAFMADSVINFCDMTDGSTNSNDGAKKCAYVEAEFANQENGGWSGYDVSNIQNVGGTCGVSVQGGNGPVSSCTQNNYDTSNVAVGGVGGNIAPGPLHLTATFSDPS